MLLAGGIVKHKIKLVLRGFGEKTVEVTGWPLSFEDTWYMRSGAFVRAHYSLETPTKNKKDWFYGFSGFTIN